MHNSGMGIELSVIKIVMVIGKAPKNSTFTAGKN